tara:strand:- start:109 stop:570 length:462 start_codon:yes stop_codon:yes gene_type:complete
MIQNVLLRIFYDFKFYRNIYTDLERQSILEKTKFYLQEFNNSPGLQTPSNIHKEVDLLKLFKACGGVNVEKCWLNYTRKGFPDHYCWHTHPHRYTCVYYFDDGPGTVFKGIRKNFQINVLKDTLVVFPAHLFHSAPLHDESERYTIAFDFDGY